MDRVIVVLAQIEWKLAVQQIYGHTKSTLNLIDDDALEATTFCCIHVVDLFIALATLPIANFERTALVDDRVNGPNSHLMMFRFNKLLVIKNDLPKSFGRSLQPYYNTNMLLHSLSIGLANSRECSSVAWVKRYEWCSSYIEIEIVLCKIELECVLHVFVCFIFCFFNFDRRNKRRIYVLCEWNDSCAMRALILQIN